METNTGVVQFYRQPLQDTCIAFSSENGKKIFREALSGNYMESYFKLAAQFRTQDEPSYCGLTSLVMVLNSLQVDPGRVWKGPWRWYHESMLDCCTPLQLVKKEGMLFTDMVCLALCSGLKVNSSQIDTSDTDVEKFRQVVRDCCSSEEHFLVLNYCRKVLGQTGAGHYSPVGGYHADQDLVLILDTARFKYEPYWVPVPVAWRAMQTVDPSTGLPRGFLMLSRDSVGTPLLLFRISNVFSAIGKNHVSSDVERFLEHWKLFLSDNLQTISTDEGAKQISMAKVSDKLDEAVSGYDKKGADMLPAGIQFLLDLTADIKDGHTLLTTQVDLECVQDQSPEHASCVELILDQLETTSIFRQVNTTLKQYRNKCGGTGSVARIGQLSESTTCKVVCCGVQTDSEKCSLVTRLQPSHFLTVFLLAWPYKSSDSLAWIGDMPLEGRELQGEVTTLKKQFEIMLGFCCSGKTTENVCMRMCRKDLL